MDQDQLNTSAAAWSQLLSQVGFSNVRIKGGNGESPSLQTAGTEATPTYRVVGVLTSSNQLHLPKGRFGMNDRAALAQWLEKLREWRRGRDQHQAGGVRAVAQTTSGRT